MTAPPAEGTSRATVGAAVQVGTEVSINLGSSLAGLVIPAVGAPIVVAARQLVMLVTVAPFYRPGRTRLSWPTLWPALLLGVDLAVMNLSFYSSVHLLGLGVAATIEFLGPLAVALIMSRRPLDAACAIVAAIGVFLLTGPDGAPNLPGVALALTAAAAWACYIALTRRVALTLPGLDGLTIGGAVSLLILLPLAASTSAGPHFSPQVLLLLLAVGVLSSALPYSLDTFILRRIPPRLYAIITAFGPVIAATFGALVLGERFTPLEVAAILLVCTAAGTALATSRRLPESDLERTAEALP
ncbi:MAG: EamA family transporter [Naasia sp.]|uniref:EamA family transporter n=1 Tax=Naasia sp. TaxID=2546198 RepID=UPI0026245562|nr:EamA family transporter [Naasia sp.]MCU1569433.1 EamA family transporter [Naasia sp.]